MECYQEVKWEASARVLDISTVITGRKAGNRYRWVDRCIVRSCGNPP